MPEQDRSADVRRIIRTYQERKDKKRRSRVIMLPFKIVFGVLFLILGVYFVISAFYAFNSPVVTTLALNTSVNDEYSVAGYFVRQESLVELEYDGILQYTIPDGSKVSRNAPFAAVYSDENALETNARIAELEDRIKSLESALKASDDTTSTEKLAATISEQLLTVTEISDHGTYTLYAEPAGELKSLIVNREFAFAESGDIEKEIQTLKARTASLRESLGEREKVLYTPKSGYFISYTDGYEEVLTVSGVKEMSVADFDKLSDHTPEEKENVLGRIITDFDWYFACTLRQEEAAPLSEGKTVTMQFDATGDLLIEAKVHHIASKTDDETIVIFTGSEHLDELILLRKQAATIILKTYEGLKVPKTALRVDEEGNLGVYVITGLYAEFKKINPIYETRDYYIVETNPTSTKSLLNNDILITGGKQLSDKKVLK